MNYSQSVVDGLYLFNQSPFHRSYTLVEFNHYLVYPLLQGKIRIFYEDQKPVSLVTWCWFSDEQAQRFLNGEFAPNESDYEKDHGDQLWGIEFIAPFGHARLTMKKMRTLTVSVYGKGQYVHFRRSYNPEKAILRRM